MATIVERPGVVRQKRFGETYIGQWIMTTDHKKIGVMYIVTAFFSFLVGGLEALLIRTQLAAPNGHVLSPEVYNEVFTMHGTTMIFLFVMPMLTGLGNYIVPLMIGARDMAFPRLNAFGYWLILFATIFLDASFLFNQAPNGGWFYYAPLSEQQFGCGVANCLPAMNADFWALGILLLGVSSIAGALNFVVTILRLRAPGMTMNRIPLFTWMTLVTSFLLLFALPSITAAAGLLLLDRHLGTHFYQASFHGDPLLWHYLGGIARLLAQAHLRLYLRRLVRCRHRLLELYGVGAPHVRGWPSTHRPGLLRHQHHAHCHSDCGENLQLDRDGLQRQGQPQGTNALRAWLHRHVLDRWPQWRGSGYSAC